MCRIPSKIYLLWCRLWFYDCLRSSTEIEDCLWKEILSQERIRHFKILQSIYFAYDVGIISYYSNRNWRLSYILLCNKWQCNLLEFMALSCSSEVLFVKFPIFLAFFVVFFRKYTFSCRSTLRLSEISSSCRSDELYVDSFCYSNRIFYGTNKHNPFSGHRVDLCLYNLSFSKQYKVQPFNPL